MPYSDFEKVAKCLDNKRLGKQRIEAWQIYNVLKLLKRRGYLLDKKLKNILSYEEDIELATYYPIAWENHPIVKMWKGHEAVLCAYGMDMCYEWSIIRGFKDTLYSKFRHELDNVQISGSPPKWIFDEELQLTHQSNLVRKFPEHYSKYFPNVPNNLEYKWY